MAKLSSLLPTQSSGASATNGVLRDPAMHSLAATIKIPLYHGPPMESNDALLNLMLLYVTLRAYLQGRRSAFIGVDMAVFFNVEQVQRRQFLAPDFFVVLDGVDGIRDSWVTWREEGRTPNMVIEMRSKGTALRDRTVKRQIYQDVLKVNDYFRFDPRTSRLDGERLVGDHYQPVVPDSNGRHYCAELDLYLVLWQGAYQGLTRRWLRWETENGMLLPSPDETAEAQRQIAEAQRQIAEAQRQAVEAAQAEIARLRRLLDER